MFEFLLISAIVIALLMGFFYFRPGSSDSPQIITKLEELNKKVYEGQVENEFPCLLRHVVDVEDQILVFLSSQEDSTSVALGAVPYEYKGRILHFLNTNNLSCQAVFNKSTEELTIDLIDDLENK